MPSLAATDTFYLSCLATVDMALVVVVVFYFSCGFGGGGGGGGGLVFDFVCGFFFSGLWLVEVVVVGF